MGKYDQLCKKILGIGCFVKEFEKLADYTTFKIGGEADLFIEVYNEKQLSELLHLLNDSGIAFFIMGNGSNLLVSDDGFRGAVIRLLGDFEEVRLLDGNILECGCGASLAKACVLALKNNLSGLEFAWGIPGSCGGAIYMNAGAYGNDISNLIKFSTYMTPDGEIKKVNREEMVFSYRKSIYTGKDIIALSFALKLNNGSGNNIRSKMYENIKKRKTNQPLNLPNCGSVFKRPGNGYYAGALIEKSGLKGKSFGGAMVSMKHAGFIVNTGNATCQDVSNLIRYIKKKVYDDSGILLECEVRTLGEVNLMI